MQAVQALVELGANINTQGSMGITPIEAACMDGGVGNVAVVSDPHPVLCPLQPLPCGPSSTRTRTLTFAPTLTQVKHLCVQPGVCLTGFVVASVNKLQSASGHGARSFHAMAQALRDAGAPAGTP